MFTPASNTELRKAISNYFNGNVEGITNIETWDTSKITDMSHAFQFREQFSVEPITLNWDTSNVTDMSFMFRWCEQDFILNFDTSKVTLMREMFCNATNFNQPLRFDTSNVTNMTCMFANATNFNQPLHFNTSNVTDMTQMFYCAKKFNQPLNFDTNKVNYMHGMFNFAINFNQPIYFHATSINYEIYYESPMSNKEEKYVLKPQYYKKLLLCYILNQITAELLYLCDDFEDYYLV